MWWFFEMRESRKYIVVSAHELRIVFAVFRGDPALVFAVVFLEPALHAEIEVEVYGAECTRRGCDDFIGWIEVHICFLLIEIWDNKEQLLL